MLRWTSEDVAATFQRCFKEWNAAHEADEPWVAEIRLRSLGSFYNLDTAFVLGVEYCVQDHNGASTWTEIDPVLFRKIDGKWRFDEINSLLNFLVDPCTP